MFLGNLSAANEHEARKKKSGKKKEKSGESVVEGSEFPHLRRCKAGDRPILYDVTKTSTTIPKEALLAFLNGCVEMMLDEGNINEMINEAKRKNMGLHDVAVNFQRDAMEFNFQIEREFGCRYLATIPDNHPGDNELIEATKNFMFTALKSYLKALHQRSRRYKSGELQAPSPTAPMSKVTILEFMEGCNALMSQPETKKELKMVAEATKEMPGPRIIEMQRSLLPVLGYDADFGVSCLNKISTDFPGDRELMGKFQLYAGCAEFAATEAMFTEEQRAAFYNTIPPMMYHFPHMYFLQQRMQQQQERMRQERFYQQQMAMERATPGSSGEVGGRLDAESLKASGMLNLLMSQEGRVKLQGLASKVQDSKTRLEPVVSAWDLERKKEYFDGFKDHPLLEVLAQSGDPGAKMMALTTMESGEIDDLMTLLLVIAQEDGGELLKSLRAQVEAESAAQKPGNSHALSQIIKTMGSLANFNRHTGMGGAPVGGHTGQGGHDHSGHSHGGHSHGAAHGEAGHVHGPSCNHGPPQRTGPDVAHTKAAAMDR